MIPDISFWLSGWKIPHYEVLVSQVKKSIDMLVCEAIRLEIFERSKLLGVACLEPTKVDISRRKVSVTVEVKDGKLSG